MWIQWSLYCWDPAGDDEVVVCGFEGFGATIKNVQVVFLWVWQFMGEDAKMRPETKMRAMNPSLDHLCWTL